MPKLTTKTDTRRLTAVRKCKTPNMKLYAIVWKETAGLEVNIITHNRDDFIVDYLVSN